RAPRWPHRSRRRRRDRRSSPRDHVRAPGPGWQRPAAGADRMPLRPDRTARAAYLVSIERSARIWAARPWAPCREEEQFTCLMELHALRRAAPGPVAPLRRFLLAPVRNLPGARYAMSSIDPTRSPVRSTVPAGSSRTLVAAVTRAETRPGTSARTIST